MGDKQFEVEKKHEIRIHIDRKPYEAPNPTTGAALYVLGKIGAHRELFREEGGDHEDKPVPNDETKIHLKQDEHFYSEKAYEIIVNGTEECVPTQCVTFEEIVNIAFPGHPVNPDIIFAVSFEHAESKPHRGTLAAGGEVTVKKHGTIFDVTQTNRS